MMMNWDQDLFVVTDHNESVTWVETGRADVLHLRRAGGWQVVSNFGVTPFPLPDGTVVLASGPLTDALPGESTVWLTA